MAFDETTFDETTFDEMAFDETVFDETVFDETVFDETAFDEMAFDETASMKRRSMKWRSMKCPDPSLYMLGSQAASGIRSQRLLLLGAPDTPRVCCWGLKTQSAIFVHCAGAYDNVSACAAMHHGVFAHAKYKDNVTVQNPLCLDNLASIVGYLFPPSVQEA